jgi:small subunit ribosomal protein S3Ae
MAPGGKKQGGKKGLKKRVIDPLTRKEWFQLRAPVPFKSESFGYTCANKSAGLKKVEDAVRGRVVTYLQADLAQQNTDYLWRKVKLVVDEVAGKEARTSFYGLDTTRDELCFSIKKWRTMIEAVCDVKTNDGYVLRVFTVAFTRKVERQKRNTAYALSSQVKLIRRKITDLINKEVNKSNVTQILESFTTEVIHEKITKEIKKIFPVENIKVRKIKVIQRPKIDSVKLNEMHDPERRNKAIARLVKKSKKEGKPVVATLGQEDPEAQNLLTAA